MFADRGQSAHDLKLKAPAEQKEILFLSWQRFGELQAYKAASTGPAKVAYGQNIGAVVPGDVTRLSLTVASVVEGLISLSVAGKFGVVPVVRQNLSRGPRRSGFRWRSSEDDYRLDAARRL
jgi:hypothetical protein